MPPARLELCAFYDQGAFHIVNTYMGYMIQIRVQILTIKNYSELLG